MTHATELDLGPLTWVKSEIDLALARADEALAKAANPGGFASGIQFARTHLHQACGALSIVGLDGLTQFTESLERLLATLARDDGMVDGTGLGVSRRAVAAIGNYLEELVHGTPDQPLRLYPLYAEMAQACGDADASRADLFFPDLSLRPPRRAPGNVDARPGDWPSHFRPLRAQFERGLLEWLRDGAAPAGPSAMREASKALESLLESTAPRALWWAAQAYFDALLAGDLGPEAGTRRVCTMLAKEFRQTSDETRTVPDKLMRELLYGVCQAPARTELQREVRRTWRLETLLPEPGATVTEIPLASLLKTLHTELNLTKRAWDEFCSGQAAALPRYEAQLESMFPQATRLGRPAVDRLIDGMREFARWLRKDPLRFTESMALEVAGALLLAEGAFGRGAPDVGFSAQVTDTLVRLQCLQRGEALQPVEQSATVETNRRAQERDALVQVSREILTNLAQTEQSLDDFFRNQSKRAPLAALAKPLKQIEGALTLIGDDQAIALVREATATVAKFATDEALPDHAEFERLARQLSALGFYVQALQHGRASLDAFLHPQATVAEQPAEPEFGSSAAEEARATAPTKAREPAEHVVESGEGRTTSAAPASPESPAVEAPTATIASQAVPPTSTSDETAAVAAEADRDEGIDAELLAIFIEEAHDVLANIESLRADCGTAPISLENLTTIRRGFHTLKGSGRMVGLQELGEAAWQIEQTLNRWLQLDLEPTPELGLFIDDAHGLFSGWVGQIEAGKGLGRDASAVVARAERLREDDTAPAPPVATADAQLPAAAPEARVEAPELKPDVSEAEVSQEFAEIPETVSDAAGPAPAENAPQAADTEPASLELGEPTEFSLDIEGLVLEEADQVSESVGARIDSDEFLPDEVDLEDLAPTDPAPEAHADDTVPIESAPAAPKDLAPSDALEAGTEEALEPPASAARPEIPREASPSKIELDLSDLDLSAFDFGDLPAGKAVDAPAADAETSVAPASDAAAPVDVPSGSELTIGVPDGTAHETAPVLDASEAASAETTPDDEAATEPPPADAAAPDSRPTAGNVVQLGDAEISRPLFDLYVQEARQHIATLHAEFQHLRDNPTRTPSESVLRAAHTLAGISGTAHVLAMHHLARALEHALERLRESSLPPAPAHTDLLSATHHTLDAMLAEAAALKSPLPVPELEEQLADVGLASATGTTPPPDHVAASIRQIAAALGQLPTGAPEPDETPSASVHDDIDEQLLPIFLDEAAELLSSLHAALRGWQNDTEGDDHAKATARLLHTLKGSARMTGAMVLGEHLHQLESRLESALKSGQNQASLIDDLLSGLDQIEPMVGALSGKPALPELATPPAETAASTAVAIEAGAIASDAGGGTLRVRADTVDRFVNEAGEIGIARTRIEGELRTLRRSLLDLTENVIRLRNQLREVEIQAEIQMHSRIAQAETQHSEFDPLEMDRFTRLQELTRMMAESVGDVTTVQQSLLRNLDGAELALHGQARLSRDLQQALMRVRMVPFDSLADRLHRVVRQSAKDLGKRVNLDIRGGRIEVDRSVLERMTAALEHLLRNAVAHGIEGPDLRRRTGKDEIGQITLSVSQEGNEIVIVLADDGGGLDFDAIAVRARNKGLLGADEAADPARLTNLIFVPGFSTADSLSTVSGRGVGMDVVKAETAAVGGRMDVHSGPGRGTEFRIYLPLTLAVTQALLIRAANRSYAIPSSMIAQVMELRPDAVARLREEGGIEWGGERFAYRYLPNLLGDRDAQAEVQRFNWVLLLRAGAQTLALHVDSLRGNQEIVVKNAGPQLIRIIGISGATVMGDGEIVLILNPVALASRSLNAEERPAMPPVPGEPREIEPAVQTPSIMIVDDSLTVRKITGRLLEREGYRVIAAKDGTDALEKLLEMVPDVILSDIEMPRMDGFDLLRNIRADERTRHVPVIMITSRLADRHRERAVALGADHYLGKPYDEEELLGLLTRYTASSVS